MKKTILSMVCVAAATALPCSAQVMGQYRFIGSDQNPNGSLNLDPTTAESLKPTYVASECLHLSSISPSNGYTPNPRTWSTNTKDHSITTSPTHVAGNGISGNHANCFGGWGTRYSSSKLVEFKLTMDDNAVGQVNKLSLQIGNYGNSYDPDSFYLIVRKSSSSTFYYYNRKITDKWENQTFDLSSLGLTSAQGSTDTFTFQISAYGENTTSSGLIALDDIKIEGKHECVPEPTTAVLLGLGAFATILRRRK